jgi:hypothetical protein
MEADEDLSEESSQVSERLASIQWVTLESIQDICNGHPSQLEKALKILQCGEVRNLNCRPINNGRFRVHGYVHSEYILLLHYV